ncbi:MAG: hypothetical protein KC422_07440 [Trueperaceae bacterium]|nr:hypothetical protein [Trueperaceae bacterium]
MKPWFRTTLFLTAFNNFLGSLVFFPPFFLLRRLLGFPISHSFFLGVLWFYILLFGLVYAYFAIRAKADRSLIVVGLLGKAFFALYLLYFGISGQIPWLAALSGLPDLLFAFLFMLWLLETRKQSQA